MDIGEKWATPTFLRLSQLSREVEIYLELLQLEIE